MPTCKKNEYATNLSSKYSNFAAWSKNYRQNISNPDVTVSEICVRQPKHVKLALQNFKEKN